MALQRGFLHRKLHFSEIPLTRRLMGPFMGVLMALTFYALLYFFRDIFRDLSARQPEFFWELSKEEINFYNFFYASISSLLGQSVCFNIWFHRSREMFSLPKLLGIRVLNDQIVLIWYFLAWFGKLAFVYWIFFGLTFWGGHYIFSFYPDYNYLFYLILAVLFLQSWTSFRQLFVKQSLKWMIISALILGAFSFGLSRINLIDQEAFRYNNQRESIYFKYDFELPQSEYYEWTYNHLSTSLQLVLDSSNATFPYSVLLENQKIALSKLAHELQLKRNRIHEIERGRFYIKLFVDHRVTIELVEKVKAAIANTGISKVYFMVVPSNPEYDVRYYTGLGIPERILTPLYLDSLTRNNLVDSQMNALEPLPTVSPKKIRINSDKVSEEQLVELFTERFRDEPQKIIRYNYNPEDPFSKYIKILAATHQAIALKRNTIFQQKADSTMTSYDQYLLQQEIRNDYPVGFIATPKKK